MAREIESINEVLTTKSYLDKSFLEDVVEILERLNSGSDSSFVKDQIRELENASFPIYILFIKLIGRLFDKILQNIEDQLKQKPYDITLMQLFILDPLCFFDKYRKVFGKSLKGFSLNLLHTPKNVFWCWSDGFDVGAREVFKVISSHPEGLTKAQVFEKLKNYPLYNITKHVGKSSILRKYYFIVWQSGRYYPFFSDHVNKQSLSEARQELRKQVEFTKKLLSLEYKTQKYHVDVLLKFLKAAKDLTLTLRNFSDKNLEVSNPKIVRALLRTRKKGLSKYMISRIEERFEALQLDGLLQTKNGNYFITKFAKDLIENGLILIGSHYAEILLFEERIVKKGHDYWDTNQYLNFMINLKLVDHVSFQDSRVYKLTQTGVRVLRQGFDPQLLVTR